MIKKFMKWIISEKGTTKELREDVNRLKELNRLLDEELKLIEERKAK